MSSQADKTQAICKEIQEKYSCCDVSDALLVLGVSYAGHLSDIPPLSHPNGPSPRLVAPVSTVLFVSKSHETNVDNTSIPKESNIPKDRHWTDVPAPGSVAILLQPPDQICALLGDIVATRLKVRGVAGVIVDGRSRDVAGCSELCTDGQFAVWSKGFSTVGTSLEAKPWAVNVPVKVGGVEVKPGDYAVLDEAEKGIVVIPKEKLAEVADLLPELKEADDAVLRDVQAGVGLKEAFQRHLGHYTNR